MRRLVILVALLFGMPTATHAQSGELRATPERVVTNIIARAYKGVTLTPEQKEGVRLIVDRSLSEQGALDFSAIGWQEKRAALLEKRNAELRALLTTDADRAKFDVNIKTL